jgi:hypothetical protein
MRIILEASRNDESCNGGCEFAFLDLTPELAELPRLAGRRHAIGRDRDTSVRGVYRRPSAEGIERLIAGTLEQGF